MTLHGARQFRSRLNAIRDTGMVVAKVWAEEGEEKVRAEIPRDTGATAQSIDSDADRSGGQITGSKVVRYLMGGTRSHSEEPTSRDVMKFAVGGATIFSKRVQHPGTPQHPRIAEAARNALEGMAKACRELWNRAA